MKRTQLIIGLTLLLVIAFTGFGAYYLKAQTDDLYDRTIQLTSAHDRKDMVRGSTPREKVKLWKRQLAYALEHEKFTEAQKAVIDEGRTYLLPEYFDGTHTIPDDFEHKAHTAFADDKDLYRDTFEIPGNSVISDRKTCKPATGGATSFLGFFWTPVVNYFYPPWPECSCNFSIGCDSGSCGEMSNCQEVINCGPFGQFTCYHTCVAGYEWNT